MRMNAEQLRVHRQLNSGRKAVVRILWVRPPKPSDEDEYTWTAWLIEDESKYWKALNRYLNAKWETKTTEVSVDFDLMDKQNRQ